MFHDVHFWWISAVEHFELPSMNLDPNKIFHFNYLFVFWTFQQENTSFWVITPNAHFILLFKWLEIIQNVEKIMKTSKTEKYFHWNKMIKRRKWAFIKLLARQFWHETKSKTKQKTKILLAKRKYWMKFFAHNFRSTSFNSIVSAVFWIQNHFESIFCKRFNVW